MIPARLAAASAGVLFLTGNGIAADAPADPIARYAQLPAMVEPRLAPGGKQLAFLGLIDGRYHVVIERFVPNFERYLLVPSVDLEFEWVRWVNDERLLVVASGSARRDQWVHINARHVVDSEESRLVSISNTAQDVVSVVLPAKVKSTGSRVAHDLPVPQLQHRVVNWLPNEPHHVLLAVDSDHDGLGEVRRIDVRNGKYKDVVSNYLGPEWLTDTSGAVRFTYGPSPDNQYLRGSYTDAGGNWVEVTTADWFGGALPIAILPGSNTAIVRGPDASGREVIRELDLPSGAFGKTLYADPVYDAGDAVTDDVTGALVGVRVYDDLGRIEYFDEGFCTLQRTTDKALPDARNTIESTSTNQRQVFIRSISGSGGGSYYLWDRDASSLDFYAEALPALSADDISPTAAVSYKARDGLTIPAYLTLPAGENAEALPAIVLAHGGPHDRADGSYHYIAQYLASRGYAVLQPNFRGSSGYGRTFADAGKREWGGKIQDDIADGARWLSEQGVADPDRLCIVGWSFGGYAAAMGAIRSPALYHCAVSINGILDIPRQMHRNLDFIGGRMMNDDIGVSMTAADSISPAHQSAAIEAPLLLVHAKDDPRVDVEQARDMAKRLERLDKPVELVEIEFGGHSLHNIEARETILRALGAFLDKYNPPG